MVDRNGISLSENFNVLIIEHNRISSVALTVVADRKVVIDNREVAQKLQVTILDIDLFNSVSVSIDEPIACQVQLECKLKLNNWRIFNHDNCVEGE